MYTFDSLFDASLNDPYRKVWTIGDIINKANSEDAEPMKRNFSYHLRKHEEAEKAKTWFDKLLDKIYV